MLTYERVLQLHRAAIREFGGSNGIRDQGLIRSAIAQPHQTFGGVDLYPTPIAKVAALGWALTKNHGFVDGNKRVGWLATKVALFELGYHLNCPADEAETLMLGIVAGEFNIADFTLWIESVIVPVAGDKSEECHQAILRLGEILGNVSQMVNNFGDSLEYANQQKDYMELSSTLNSRRRQRKIHEIVALSANNLTTVLNDKEGNVRTELQIIEICTPYIADWLNLSIQQTKLEKMAQLIFLGTVTEATENVLIAMDRFQTSLEKMASVKSTSRLHESANSLSIAIDNFKFLFNQNWFSFKEMLDIAKQKLDES